MRKKLLICLLALIMLSSAAACSPEGTDISPSATGLAPQTEAAVTPTPEPTPTPTVIDQDNPFEWLEEYDRGAVKGYDNLNITGVDALGRVIDAAAAKNQDYSVGMFYNAANGFAKVEGIYDITKLLEEYGEELVFYQNSELSPENAEHWWGEPLYGYYKAADAYIAKKHVELLTAAGVDYLVMDVTNGWTYPVATTYLLEYIVQLRQQGWDTPQVIYYVHSLNNKTVRELYSSMYSNSAFEEAWYKVDGKPAIIAYTDTEKDKAEAATRGVTDFSSSDYDPLSQEILDYFYFVEPRWPNDTMGSLVNTPIYDPDKKEGYAWIEWTQPLPVRSTSLGSYMNVSVASHPSIPFSFSITHGANNWSRAYNPVLGVNAKNGVMEGTYFQACWDQVLETMPDTIMLVSWNMWTVLKLPYQNGEYMYVDTVTLDYSLSIEMAKGAYEDNYYMQSAMNIRDYKFTGDAPAYEAQTIDINGSYAQWYITEGVYRQIGKDAYRRMSSSVDGSITYRTTLPDNNIQEIRVAHDKNNLYFMLRTEKDITSRKDGELSWMNLFIGAGKPALEGWEGYEYVLNRSGSENSADIVKLNADFTGEIAGQADMKIDGNRMFLCVPRSLVGMQNETEFYFKAADSVAAPEDIMEYYVSGSVMPMGRLSYAYKMAE